jgi:hypothetical protein
VLEATGHRAASRGAQLVLVRVQVDRAATLGSGAAPTQRAGGTRARAKLARPVLLIGAVRPAGHLTMPADRSMRKSWMVNPPGIALASGSGLIVWGWPAARSAARVAPPP